MLKVEVLAVEVFTAGVAILKLYVLITVPDFKEPVGA
jgi:hypothetical protein